MPTDPSQATLDAMLDGVTRIRVLDDGTNDGKAIGSTVLLECCDSASIDALRRCLTIIEDPHTFGHCMCLGNNAIECYADHRLVATIGLHHGKTIRWDVWRHDGRLRDGLDLVNWLAGRGVTGPLEEFREEQQRTAEAEEAAQRWYDAIPPCLRLYWPQMQGFTVDLEPLRQALSHAYPDGASCARALFEWFGSGMGPWSGFPMYEEVAERLLSDFPTEALITALSQQSLSPRHLEGAARYFAGWEFSTHRPGDIQQLPVELKRLLLTHSRTSSNSEMCSGHRKASDKDALAAGTSFYNLTGFYPDITHRCAING
jgi:hypothetical protein